MKSFYESFGFIIAFMFLTMLFQFTLGSEFVSKFLVLVLASMIVMNSEKFATVFKGLQGDTKNE